MAAPVSPHLDRRGLGTFFALAIGLSWAYWIPVATLNLGWSHVPGLLGPAVAAIVVTVVREGMPGLRSLGARLVRGRVGPRWYVVAVTPYLMALALAGLVTLSGSPWPQLPAWSRIEGLPELGLLGTGLVLLVVNGFGEEVGWRGYAVDRLITGHGTVATGLFVAGPWAVWHLPTFFLPTGLASMSPALAVGWLVGLVAGSVVLTWLYVSSGRSIWIVSLFHTALNLGSAVPAAEGLVAAGVSTAVMIGAVLIAFAERRRR